MLDILGCRQSDSRILEAIVLVGPVMEVEKFDFDGEKKATYFEAVQRVEGQCAVLDGGRNKERGVAISAK